MSRMPRPCQANLCGEQVQGAARYQVVHWRRSSAYASLVSPRYPARNPRARAVRDR
jgi:hypothetical protein